MAKSDIEVFLEDLLLRYDPNIDITDGARAQTEIIQPILNRIGSDPFDQDIQSFIRDRLVQAFPNLSLHESAALEDGLVSPLRVLLEPVVREIKLVKLRQSLSNVESLADDEVDALLANFFASREVGGFSRGVVRAYFSAPTNVSFTLIQVASTRGGLRFIPDPSQQVTAQQMLLNREGQEFYADIAYVAERQGDEYNVDRGEVSAISNLSGATRVINLNRFEGGTPRENSLEFLARVESQISDRTLTVGRGIIAELSRNFPGRVKQIQVVGFKDPEMQRDVVEGGGLGPVRPDDALGTCVGVGSAVDDLDGNTTTSRVSCPGAFFVSRVASAGTNPDGAYLTVVYTPNPTLPPSVGNFPVMVDAKIVEVISDTEVILDHVFPSFPLSLTWALRRREITISGIPGGITLPDTVDGELLLTADKIHIGGKTDLYIAGNTETETLSITGIADQSPVARGYGASTTINSSTVTLVGVDPDVAAKVQVGDTLVLGAGVDAGGYTIRSLNYSSGDLFVGVPVDMTGTQSNLAWRITDEIDVELTEPKDIRIEGADGAVVAGNPTFTTLSSTNFLAAGVQADDIVRIDADAVGGDYRVLSVGAISLQLDPAPPRTVSNLKYIVYRPNTGMQTPVVRVSKMELLDSGGAPNGVEIPYRDAVAVVSRGFQNESQGIAFEGLVRAGLISGSVSPIGLAPGLYTLDLETRDPKAMYLNGTPVSISLTVTGGLVEDRIDSVVATINADPGAAAAGIFASRVDRRLYLYCPRYLEVLHTGTVNVEFSFNTSGRRNTNAEIRVPSTAIRPGDSVQFLGPKNAGITTRANFVTAAGSDVILDLGTGPVSAFTSSLFQSTPVVPDLDSKVRIGRPSVGTARAYFLSPTSANFPYETCRASISVNGNDVVLRPDPENIRVLLPGPPTTELPNQGDTTVAGQLVDTTADFFLRGIRPGDVLEVLYAPLTSTSPLAAPPTLLPLAGTSFELRFGDDSWITVAFPMDMLRDDAATYINDQVGEECAKIDGTGRMSFVADRRISLRDTGAALVTGALDIDLTLRDTTTAPNGGLYVIASIPAADTLSLSQYTPLAAGFTEIRYRVVRHVQRFSSTDMNLNIDETGFYYADIEMLSLAPGDVGNVPPEALLTLSGYESDGYRLYSDNDTLTYSRAERLFAEISPTILLPGSSDNPEEYVQLSGQNVQVSYDRSQLVDDVQSYVESDLNRVTNEEILVRHLLPNYIELNWRYVGGDTELTIRQALRDYIEALEPSDDLEAVDLTKILTSRGATSVYSISPQSSTGRTAPLIVVVHHDVNRRVRAEIVKDFTRTSTTQRFFVGDLTITRVSPGIRRI